MTEIVTDDDDFVMIERGGQIMSGGFKVDSLLLKYKKSPMYTLNKSSMSGGGNNVSDLFKDLAVPAGIFFQQRQIGGRNKYNNEKIVEEDEIDDDLYDKLTKLATTQETYKKNKSKKARKDLNKSTKKNYKVK